VAWPRAIAGAGIAITALAALPLGRFARAPLEYDFDKLRSQVPKRHSGSEDLAKRLDPIFGRSLSPSFVLADSPAQVAAIRAVLLERDRSRHVLGDVKSIDDYLPGSAALQPRKLAVLAEIRRLLDRNWSLLDEEQQARARKLRPPDDLRVLAAPDLPRSILRFYTEVDGTVGRIVIWYARDGLNVWDGRVLVRLAEIVRDVALPDGTRVRSSGAAVVFAAMLDAVARDAPIATACSLVAVLLLVSSVARRQGAWLALASLATGVFWMVGGVAAAGVRINFINFIALPITFGIATDYGINLLLRYRLEHAAGTEAALERSVASTGGAVALCSLTTVIGYGALLVADTQGLRTFGAAAILGELACVTSAVVMMPAVLALLERRRRANRDRRLAEA
jgi:hypothetical protein